LPEIFNFNEVEIVKLTDKSGVNALKSLIQ
jgi:hypothetical protein